MSDTELLTGYAVKVGPILDEQHSDDLIDNFNSSLTKEWQPFYDESGDEYLVWLTDSGTFEGDLSTSVNIKQISIASETLHKYLEDGTLDAIDIHFFVKVWYNGVEMGNIIGDQNE